MLAWCTPAWIHSRKRCAACSAVNRAGAPPSFQTQPKTFVSSRSSTAACKSVDADGHHSTRPPFPSKPKAPAFGGYPSNTGKRSGTECHTVSSHRIASGQMLPPPVSVTQTVTVLAGGREHCNAMEQAPLLHQPYEPSNSNGQIAHHGTIAAQCSFLATSLPSSSGTPYIS